MSTIDSKPTPTIQTAGQIPGSNYPVTHIPYQYSPDGRTSNIATINKKEMIVASGSCIGGRSENQDNYRTAYADKPGIGILTVCDGMGGANGGRIASEIAADTIISLAFHHAVTGKEFTPEVLCQIIAKANDMIYNKAVDEPPLRGMGTTATLVVITPEAAYVAHVGDSRIYLLRDGKKVFRTWDHSRVFDMVEDGILTEEMARTSAYSNVITRALGIRPKVEVTVDKIPYRAGDRFIVCCDGIWNRRPEPEMIRMFCHNEGTTKEMEYLVSEIDAEGIKSGGNHDNLTVIVADVFEDSEYQYPLSQRISNGLRRSFLGRMFGRKDQATAKIPAGKDEGK